MAKSLLATLKDVTVKKEEWHTRWVDALREAVEASVEQGLSVSEIATAAGVKGPSVKARANKWGLDVLTSERASSTISDALFNRVKELRESGTSWQAAAALVTKEGFLNSRSEPFTGSALHIAVRNYIARQDNDWL